MDVNNESKIIKVGVYDLLTHPYQPRFDEESDIAELAKSIEEFGLLNKPKVVMHPTDAGKYFIVAGHRRVRALKKIGLQVVDVELLTVDDPRIPLVDNMFRRELSPVELAFFFKKAIADEVFVTPESICSSTGKERFYVDILIEVSKLPEKLLEETFLKNASSKTLSNITILGMLAKLYHSSLPEYSTPYVIGAIDEMLREEKEFGFVESDAKNVLVDAMNDLKNDNAKREMPVVEEEPKTEENPEYEEDIFDAFDEDDDFDGAEEVSEVEASETKAIKDLGLEIVYDEDWDSVFIRIKVSDLSNASSAKLKSSFDKILSKI